MKLDTPLPAPFHDFNICLLEAFALKDQLTPQRVVRTGNGNFETRLSPMKVRALRLRLDGELHGFVEDGGNVSYLPSSGIAVVVPPPPPSMVAVQMIGQWATGSDPPARAPAPPSQLKLLEPPRTITIHRIKTKSELTLLLIDERTGQTIAVIGARIHWDLAGLNVRFEITDGSAL